MFIVIDYKEAFQGGQLKLKKGFKVDWNDFTCLVSVVAITDTVDPPPVKLFV